MLYSKLPIVLLSAIASEKNNSTNQVIASYILTHLEEMKTIGITEFAKKCHVSTSSIPRFCKEIGLTDFAELEKLIIENDFKEDVVNQENLLKERISSYSNKINQSILKLQTLFLKWIFMN